MFFGQSRDEMRRFYSQSWRKYRDNQLLQPLEIMVAEVVAQHPEYHSLLDNEERTVVQEFSAETGEGNPFMHMGMHLGLREQLTTNRPAGITAIYDALVKQSGDTHEVEHRMMDCLGQAIWEAQQAGVAPNEENYLECLRRL